MWLGSQNATLIANSTRSGLLWVSRDARPIPWIWTRKDNAPKLRKIPEKGEDESQRETNMVVQDWEEKIAEHLLLNACLVVYLRIGVNINVNEDQEKDARKVVFGWKCFGHRASMRSPIKSRAGRKKEESTHSWMVVVFVELVSLRRRWRWEHSMKCWMFLVFLICLVRRLLERPLLMFYLRIRAKINVSGHQENDARNGFCGCVEMCFGYRASMRSPIETRAGRKIIAEHL